MSSQKITDGALFLQLHAYKAASGRSYLRYEITCQAKKTTKDQVLWPEVKIVSTIKITDGTLLLQLHAYKAASGRSYLRCGSDVKPKRLQRTKSFGLR